MDILYEDKYITVCVKAPGVLSEEEGNKMSMPKLLKEHYESAGEKKEIYTVHRLDKNVGGIMVFARTPKAASILASAIGERSFLKEYLAVVYGVPQENEGDLSDLLLHDASKNKTYVVNRMRKGVREASLHYKLLSTVTHDGTDLSLLKIRLHTGRTHQIRVQFASRKMPLVGDGRYGSGDGKDTPALWAYHLAFAHPKTDKAVDLSAAPPDVFPFNLFEI